MADITSTPQQSTTRKRRSHKKSTTVDLTAMVDLGFLLITFFMLSTKFGEPYVIEVNKPLKPENDHIDSPLAASKVATLLLGKHDRIYGYNLPDEVDLNETIPFEKLNYSAESLRVYIRQRQQAVKDQWGDPDELYILIKPVAGAAYKNMIDVFDEMLICGVKGYTIMEPTTTVDSLVILQAGESLK